MTTVNNQAQNNFFNLHTKGIGYINRFRLVNPKGKKSQPFCAVTIGFLRGSADEVEYTYIDTIIRNKEVCELLKQHESAINDENSKVLGVCVVGDIYAETFTKHDNSIAAGIKGRLIGLNQLKINGNVVYQREREDQGPVDNQPAPVAQAPAAAPVQQPVA
ncbi:MAG: DUF3577 domain-containing protein [Methyloprofundus sp.]|nr:DUF3577 domain-containing protein [Methyloprofundus sp.]